MKTNAQKPFLLGEYVQYVNHVTGCNLGQLIVIGVTEEFVITTRLFNSPTTHKFSLVGRAIWSSNLSIRHETKEKILSAES